MNGKYLTCLLPTKKNSIIYVNYNSKKATSYLIYSSVYGKFFKSPQAPTLFLIISYTLRAKLLRITLRSKN